MVLYIMKYDILPDKTEAYGKWAVESAIPRILEIPGFVELRGYRPATGSYRFATTYEFKDMSSWAAWVGSPEYQKIMEEFLPFASLLSTEVWGPSPVAPEPLRPKR